MQIQEKRGIENLLKTERRKTNCDQILIFHAELQGSSFVWQMVPALLDLPRLEVDKNTEVPVGGASTWLRMFSPTREGHQCLV